MVKLSYQLSSRLRAPDRPRQPDLRHDIHPTQRAREDRLSGSRRDPSPREDLPREHEEHAPHRSRIRM